MGTAIQYINISERRGGVGICLANSELNVNNNNKNTATKQQQHIGTSFPHSQTVFYTRSVTKRKQDDVCLVQGNCY